MSAAEPRTLWGWNRLDDAAAARVVAAADPPPGSLVVDLGAGTGALTRALVRRGVRVVAVELHRGRADVLRRRFAADPVVVAQADLRTWRYPDEPFTVVANPPWAIADGIRARLLREPRLVRADLIVPRWLARRWAAADHRVSVGVSVRAEAFRPAAPCGAAVAIVRGTASGRGSASRRTSRCSGRASPAA